MIQVQIAELARLTANMNRGEGQPPYKLSDFLVRPNNPGEAAEEEAEEEPHPDLLKAYNAFFRIAMKKECGLTDEGLKDGETTNDRSDGSIRERDGLPGEHVEGGSRR